MSGHLKARFAPWAIAVLSGLIALALVIYIAPIASLETKLRDIRIAAMQPPADPSSDIAIIALDEATLAGLPYRSPIDRGLLADIIEALEAKGARAIAVDVIIDQPTEQTKDDRLRAVFAKAKVPVRFSFSSSSRIVTEEQLDYLTDFVPPAARIEAGLLTDPYDGMVRRINPGGQLRNGKRVFTELKPEGFVPTMARLSGAQSPPRMPLEIAWRARPDVEGQPFPTYSATYLPFLPDALIAGKTVLVGAVLSMTDRHLTPLSIIDDGDQGHMPGVMLQAHGISQVLEGRMPPVVPLPWQVAATLLFSLTGAGISLWRRGILFNVGVAAGVAAVYWVGAIVGYGQGLPMLPLVGPTLAMALAMWMMDLLIGRGERQQREFIQRTFSRYVSPSVVEELVRDPSTASISGSRREASFIFTDVAGFTTLSEKLEPEALSDVLNSYLDGACKIILDYQGTIDKFIGDAIMVVFNAPITQADHAEIAVRCALDLDAYAEAFRIDCVARGIPLGITRIGVHRGEAIIGNFGSQSRMDFTALGDTVNTAARTEGVNKYFGTRICCTQAIVEACPNQSFRPIGQIVLKGKHTATCLYVPVAADEDQALLDAYGEAYRMLDNESEGATERFEHLATLFQDDPLVRFHCERIAAGHASTKVVMDDK
ncbi:MAG: adenylate/guanylate cyclase domain-containing protein [Parasphingorhabdus sp.]